MFRERLDEAGATLAADFEVESILVTSGHLDHALMNLVDNALRHGAGLEAPRIVVGSRRGDGETRPFVSDNGAGVPPEHHGRIFELLPRLSTDGEGTGVGLTMVQRVAGAYGGRAWIESTPGRGATFWMSVPDREASGGDPPGDARALGSGAEHAP